MCAYEMSIHSLDLRLELRQEAEFRKGWRSAPIPDYQSSAVRLFWGGTILFRKDL